MKAGKQAGNPCLNNPGDEILYVSPLKSDNLQYNILGRWVDRLIDQESDGPSIILIDSK